jgi:3'-phosphoadenosine 5'-phosphosulfate sulfotransferase (PAPS reductase)/FAD synthetase
MNLRSVMSDCPRCGRDGLAMPKWVPGRIEKPVYVLHDNNGGRPKRCRLRQTQADQVREEVQLSRTDLKRLLRKAAPYVLFSGGRDSLCLLLYLKGLAKSTGAELTAIHIDTTAGFPEVTKYVRMVCRRLGVRLVVVRPKRDYFELAKRWGIPNHSARWCCKELKVKPVRDYLAQVDGFKIVFDGIRAAESAQRSKYLPIWYHPSFRCLSVSPIIGWSNEEVRSYVKASGLPPSPAADFGCSAECWCGAYKKRSDFEKLLQVHPDIFDKLVAVERAQKGRFTFIYEDGKRIPLETLRNGSRKRDPVRRRSKARKT